ncbi:MAG: hypothetical protein HN742_03055 [Lentisphaerae bacterium]|jgi:hypothetical protein|nr:hypothetical protein [Lentisphaerota bacterium]MBT4814617.1 hypothetical protein [Lentisphaerota bacterium]MBT5605448.1 hypothetical protein [Lentisphaerota bacterium]MBT7060121.1 hypothetical protein [Lentisphaerota bacterium]MBT7840819.1 hypothetical protein [Lentisphaerota bacterium]
MITTTPRKLAAGTLSIAMALLLSGCGALRNDDGLLSLGYTGQQITEHRAERARLARRPHRLVFNNDGCDAAYYPAKREPTPTGFLDTRTTPLPGTQVDTLSYCTISSGFSLFTHNTKVGEVLDHDLGLLKGRRNLTPDLIAQGTDTLQVVTDYCHKNNLECFWSMRMNDTHDGAHRPDKPHPLLPRLKVDHPKYLNGALDDRPRYGSWTSVNYALPVIRDLAFQFVEEVCRNYDVDGIELDFFRHMSYLKSVARGGEASGRERRLMTKLMRRIRAMTEEVGMKRGRPILIAARVPDSAGYARLTGLDIETWMQEGLVDIMIGSGYFKLNPWAEWVALGKPYGIPMYAGLSESRVRGTSKRFSRHSAESYRARTLRAWNAGLDGIYIFNVYNARNPFLKEVGDPAGLATLDKLYFATVRDGKPGRYLANGERFDALPKLTPTQPWEVTSGASQGLVLNVGDDVAAAAAQGLAPTVTCHLQLDKPRDPATVGVQLNGAALGPGKAEKEWIDLPIPPGLLKKGDNLFDITLAPGAKPESTTDGWDMEYVCDHKLAGNRQPPWRRAFAGGEYEERVVEGALLIADHDTGPHHWPHLMYPWHVQAEDETVVEARAKVIKTSDPLGVCLRISNGQSVEYVTLEPNRVGLRFAKLSTPFVTTDAFHTYRVRIKGRDIQVFADGKLVLDGEGRYRESATKTKHWLDFLYGLRHWNKRHLYFGSASAKGMSESQWEFIRFRSDSRHAVVKDFVLKIDYPDPPGK